MQNVKRLSEYAGQWVGEFDSSFQNSKHFKPVSQWCHQVCNSQEGKKVRQLICDYGFISLIGVFALASKRNFVSTIAGATVAYLVTKDPQRCFILKHSLIRDSNDMTLSALVCFVARFVLQGYACCYFTGFIGGYTLCHAANPNLSGLGDDFESISSQMVSGTELDSPAVT